jgi:hypothetical protein
MRDKSLLWHAIFKQEEKQESVMKKMEQRRDFIVIYRLKFRSEQDFEKAVQTLRFGQNMGKYLESLQRSLGLRRPEPEYPMITPPEINFCKEDLVIYLCSKELREYGKGPLTTDVLGEGMTERMPRFPHFYEIFLKSTFGSTADVIVATGEYV